MELKTKQTKAVRHIDINFDCSNLITTLSDNNLYIKMIVHHSMMHLNSSRKINAIMYIVTHERKEDNIEIRREERKNEKER